MEYNTNNILISNTTTNISLSSIINNMSDDTKDAITDVETLDEYDIINSLSGRGGGSYSSNERDRGKEQKYYCNNCGKHGHILKKCDQPITSIGIINLYIDDLKINNLFSTKYILSNINEKYKHNNFNVRNIAIPTFNLKNNSLIDCSLLHPYIDVVKDKLKILMIRRKYSVGYIEYIKGRYDETNNDSILFLLNQMTHTEINNIKTHELFYLWINLWNNNKLPHSELDQNDNLKTPEFLMSETKFNYIRANKIFDIIDSKIDIKYDQPEWGFPKGKRNLYEKNINCAIREFMEETGVCTSDFQIMDRIYTLNELFKGTNNIEYKHSYFLSIGNLVDLQIEQPCQIAEIGDIGWFNYSQCKTLIRPYHIQRLQLLDDIVLFIAHNLKFHFIT